MTVYCEVVVIASGMVVADASVSGVVWGVQLEPPAVVVQPRAIWAEKPPIGVRVRVGEMPSPALTEPEVGVMAIEKSTPFPVSATVRTGYLVSLVSIVRLPVRTPVVVGVNVTETMQVLDPAMIAAQVVV